MACLASSLYTLLVEAILWPWSELITVSAYPAVKYHLLICFDPCRCVSHADEQRMEALLKCQSILACGALLLSVTIHFVLMPIYLVDYWRFRWITNCDRGSSISSAEWWILMAKWQGLVPCIWRLFKTILFVDLKWVQKGVLCITKNMGGGRTEGWCCKIPQ